MLRKVRATIRLAPQLKTVAIAIALPRIWAGNISLRSNHDTENVSLARVNVRLLLSSMHKVVDVYSDVWKFFFFPAVKAHSYWSTPTLIVRLIPTVSEKSYRLFTLPNLESGFNSDQKPNATLYNAELFHYTESDSDSIPTAEHSKELE